MPRRVQGVPPRVKDERDYLRLTRLHILQPLIDATSSELATASSATQAFLAIERLPLQLPLDPTEDVATMLGRMNAYHRRRMIQTFRSAVRIDITRVLTNPQVDAFLSAKVSDNVALLRTIPPRLQEGLADKLRNELRTAPFDQQRLRGVLRSEFRVQGYNLRRITRDQTNKVIGQLSEIRQRQVGVTRYTWRTAQDERVRDTHRINNSRGFEWANPPPITGHPGNDIQCRCVALPVVEFGV